MNPVTQVSVRKEAGVIVTQGPIIATATPVGQQVLPKDEVNEYQKNIKSGKWKTFKNGDD